MWKHLARSVVPSLLAIVGLSGCVTDSTLDKWASDGDGDGAGFSRDQTEAVVSAPATDVFDSGWWDSPEVEIEEPDPDGDDRVYAVFREGQVITFQGRVWSEEDDPEALTVLWSSDREGELSAEPPDADGWVWFSSGSLDAGEHSIRLTAWDTQGNEGSDSVRVCIESGSNCSE